MKIVILTEGGQKIGFGHITRCLALRDAFVAKGIKIQIAVNGDAIARRQFGGQLNHFFDWLQNRKKIQQLLKGCSIAVVDSYLAPLKLYRQISACVPMPVFIDDFLRLNYPWGVVINPAIGAEKLGYSRMNRCQHLLGSQYAMLRKEFWRVPPRNFRKRIKDVLITFGGTKRQDLTNEILDVLTAQFSDCRFHVIAARAMRNRLLKRNQIQCHSRLSAAKMRQLMLKCDAVITGGGQTTNELAACGTPMVGICFAANQRHNIRGWQRCGAMKYVGIFQQRGIPQRIASELNKMTKTVRLRMSLAARSHVNGRGALKVAEAIMNSLFSVRKVNRGDREQVFKWANDPIARSASFHADPVQWSDHCTWFKKKLTDAKSSFFIVTQKRRPIGQVRFDCHGRTATISISLDPRFRGKGLGVSVIRCVVRKFFSDTNIKRVYAYVKCDNHASLKTFIRAGFSLSHQIYSMHGCRARLLKITEPSL